MACELSKCQINKKMESSEYSEKLLALRPKLAIHQEEEENEIGHFQSNTLRPILKMQHASIIRIFEGYLLEINKIDFLDLSEEKQKVFIERSLSRRTPLKYLLIGLLVGHFTATELQFYQQHHSELHKRLTKFLAKRIFDGLSKP